MTLSGYLMSALVFVVCIYILRICLRDFRGSRGSGGVKPYVFVLGMVLSCGVMIVTALVVLLLIVRPFH
jgi:hypothetical protein